MRRAQDAGSNPQTRNLALRRQISVLVWPLLLVAAVAPALTQTPATASRDSGHGSTIVLGFVGGFVKNDDSRHPEVQIIERLSEQKLPGVHAAVFENKRTVEAREQIVRWLDANGDGQLSATEKQEARIILFGHSWGGSGVVRLAEDLGRRGIPVLLTIQIDSVNKGWGHDCVIPANVAQAMYFYQSRGFVHGCSTIQLVDSHRTKIVGSYEFEYTKQPDECRALPWIDRHFLKTHNAMGCDPRVWSQVEDQIHAQLKDGSGSEKGAVALKNGPGVR